MSDRKAGEVLAAAHMTYRSILLGLILLALASCSASVYRTDDVRSLSKEDLSVLVVPSMTNVKVLSVDGVKGSDKVGPPFPDEWEYGTGFAGGVRFELLPGKHILTIAYYERSTTFGGGEAIKYSPTVKTLEFVAEKGHKYTVTVNVSDEQWKAKVIEGEK